MFYGGMTGVPGAPGNLVAGGPSFDINRTPGALGGRSGEQLPMVYGAPGNAAGIANASMFAGPQAGQMPVGFANKMVF